MSKKENSVRDVQHTFENGLRVVLREVHSAPVISAWMVYQVGSRNERSGQTGLSHWVEHMLFKGTERFPAGVLDSEIDRAGGQWNAYTSMDHTMYYATLPADRIHIALQAEQDRMMNALFDADETEAERTVIISERQGSENDPMFWLNEEMRAMAFRVHGYHHTIIGDMADLERITRDDLYEHYRKHYVPANASLVCVGAFDAEEMLQQIADLFGDLPALPAPELFVRPEPPQQGERRVHVERPGTTAFLSMAHHVPPTVHEDWYKLEVLDSVLTGAGGGSGLRSSRLYRALVKQGIAAGLDGGLAETVDPYLYTISLTLNDGRTHAEAEAVLLAEIARIQDEGITETELRRAKHQARAAFAFGAESVTDQAFWLGQSISLGDAHWYDRFLERLNAVSAQDVQDVAQRYLVARGRVVGCLIPTGHSADNGEVPE